jgi:hypothetical protein
MHQATRELVVRQEGQLLEVRPALDGLKQAPVEHAEALSLGKILLSENNLPQTTSGEQRLLLVDIDDRHHPLLRRGGRQRPDRCIPALKENGACADPMRRMPWPRLPFDCPVALTAQGATDMHKKDKSGPAADLVTELDRRLLAIGGTNVIHRQDDQPFAQELLACGRLFLLPVKRRAGTGGQSDSSAAAVWSRDINKHHLVTGFALVAATWLPRSWVVDAKLLYDTETPAEKYFGVELDRHQALQFWLATYLLKRYPGPASLIMGLGAENETAPERDSD